METFNFWMDIYGWQIISMAVTAFTYCINKRLAITAHAWWLQKYKVQ